MTTDRPTGGETLEEWDGTAGTAVAYIRALEADRARLRAEVARRDVALRQVHDHWTAAEKRQRERADTAEAHAARLEEALRNLMTRLDSHFGGPAANLDWAEQEAARRALNHEGGEDAE